MADVRLRGEAAVDLEDLLTYGRNEFGEAVALRYAAGLRETLDLLARHPRLGHGWEASDPTIFCYVFRQHRLFYEYDADADVVWILRILHHRTDSAAHLPHNQKG
jgi:plasmid stabilization system protein ParE